MYIHTCLSAQARRLYRSRGLACPDAFMGLSIMGYSLSTERVVAQCLRLQAAGKGLF